VSDVLLIGVVVGFFALCALYVRACARIVAAGESEPDEVAEEPVLEKVGR
jgi:hypothetical protein